MSRPRLPTPTTTLSPHNLLTDGVSSTRSPRGNRAASLCVKHQSLAIPPDHKPPMGSIAMSTAEMVPTLDSQHPTATSFNRLPELPPFHRLVGLVVKASASRAEDPLAPGFYRGRVVPVTSNLALQWLPCQAPGVIGSVLGLVGPASVYCDWVRWKV